MSDQHPPPHGDGSNQPPQQPPPGGGNYPPPTSGSGYPSPPPTSGGGFPPPPPTSGGGFPPPPGPPTSGGGFPPPTSGGGFPPPGAAPGQGFPPGPTSGGPFPPPPGQPGQPGQPGYGQPGQPGYGQPGQPGQPAYGYDPNSQGFDPNAPGQPPFGAAPGAPLPPLTPQPGRQGGKLKIILAVVGAVLLLCCIGSVAFVVQNGLPGSGTAGNAKVGDCLSGKSIDQSSDEFQKADLKVIACTDGDARYKIVGKVEDKTQAQATDEVCNGFSGAEFVYWEGREGEKGTVLCLQTNNK